jgi:hypothetical protein
VSGSVVMVASTPVITVGGVGYRYTYGVGTYRYRAAIQVDEAHEKVNPAPPWFPSPEPSAPTSGTDGHGLSGYRWGRCRCDVCREAKRQANARYRARVKAGGEVRRRSTRRAGTEPVTRPPS